MATLTSSSERRCPHCGAAVGTFRADWGGQERWFWRICPCREAAYAGDRARVEQLEAAYVQAQAERLLGESGMELVDSFRLPSFDPARLRAPSATQHPYAVATRWLADAIAYGDHADYRDADSPPAGLYFYSPGRGRGKTHLAAGLAWEARALGKLTAFLDEVGYLERRLSGPLDERERLTALPGQRAWLTVIDDLGQYGKAGAWVADAWYAVLNKRWLKGGWTIITSNATPEELWDAGTINAATYSRLQQLISKHLIRFVGEDVRLADSARHHADP